MKKILVIEDNTAVNENLCEILELAGYQVFSALDGKQGTELAFSKLPDLIICDVMMPKLDGYGVLKLLSQNEKTARIPLIFLTAKSEMQDLRKGMNLGAVDYILKPFDDADLLQTIEMRLVKNQILPVDGATSAHDIIQQIATLKKQWVSQYELRSYPARSTIYSIDQHPRFVYFIIKGVVGLYRPHGTGKRLLVQLATTDESLGSYEVIGGHTYMNSAITLTDCEVILIPKADYRSLLQEDPAFNQFIHEQHATTIGKLQSALIEMAYASVRRKVALSLIIFGKAIYPDKLEDGARLRLPREDLAELVGSAKETVIRTLSDFNTEGLVELDHHDIIINDLSALQTMPD